MPKIKEKPKSAELDTIMTQVHELKHHFTDETKFKFCLKVNYSIGHLNNVLSGSATPSLSYAKKLLTTLETLKNAVK